MPSKPLDNIDAALLKKRLKKWDKIQGPRIGDWCEMPDGVARRFVSSGNDSEGNKRAYAYPTVHTYRNDTLDFYFHDCDMRAGASIGFGDRIPWTDLEFVGMKNGTVNINHHGGGWWERLKWTFHVGFIN